MDKHQLYLDKANEVCRSVFEKEYFNSLGIPLPEVKFIQPDILVKGGDYEPSQIAGADVVTKDAVEKAGWFSLTMSAIGDFFASVWNGATGFVKGLFN